MKSTSKAWLSVLLSAATVFSSSFAAVAAGDVPPDSLPAEPEAPVSAPAAEEALPDKVDNSYLLTPEKDIREQIETGEVTPEDVTIAVPSVEEPEKTEAPAAEEKPVLPEAEAEADEEEEAEIVIPGKSYRELYADRYTPDNLSEDPDDSDSPVIHSADECWGIVGKTTGSMIQRAPKETSQLPDAVDNSQKKYFPAVGDQHAIGSCASFSNVYYLMTYEYHHTHDTACTPETTMSPKFIYNMINGGDAQNGSSADSVHPLIKEWGVATMDLVPYDEDWCSVSPSVTNYRDAANHRVKEYYRLDVPGHNEQTLVTSPDDEDLKLLKTTLANGEIISYSAFIFGWREDTLKEASGVNVGHVGEKVILACDKADGGHGMTLLGYNDNIWSDINGNGRVDKGEMGAFKIANSWGEGYCNGGFCWVAYDALNYRCMVENGYNADQRTPIFSSAHRIEVVKNASPHYFVEYTLRTEFRAEVSPRLHMTWANSTVWKDLSPLSGRNYKYVMNYQGTEGMRDATFVYDLQNLADRLDCPDIREADFYIQLVDNDPTNEYTSYLVSIKIYDENDPSYSYSYTFPTPKVFKAAEDAEEIGLVQGVHNNAVIYYRGYDKPTLHYLLGSTSWTDAAAVPMKYELEELGYLYKYIIPMGKQSSVSLYFSDSEGKNVDNNGGKYFTAKRGVNLYATDEAIKPFSFDFNVPYYVRNEKVENVDDLNIREILYANPLGGVEPFRYKMQVENLDTGETLVGNEDYGHYSSGFSAGRVRSQSVPFDEEGHYKITVFGEDATGATSSNYYFLTIKDMPVTYTYMECTRPYDEIDYKTLLTFKAADKNDNLLPGAYMHYLYILHEGRLVHTSMNAPKPYSIEGRISYVQASYTPAFSGHYTAVFTRVDRSKQSATISCDFDVPDHGLSLTDMTVTPDGNVGSGDDVTISVSAKGGSGPYRYSYAYRHYTQETMVEEYWDSSTYTMTLPAEPGPYTIIATVTDADGRMAYLQKDLWVNPPHLTDLVLPTGDLYSQVDIAVGVQGENLSANLPAESYRYTLIQNGEETLLTTGKDKKGVLNVKTAGTYSVRASIVSGEAVLASMVGTVTIKENPVPPDPYPDKYKIYVAVISYIENEHSQSSYQLHYWNNNNMTGDASLTSTGKTVTKSVGSGYWGGSAQTFTLYEAYIPKTATGFKFHIGSRWFGSDGSVSSSNCVYIFNYSGDKALYDHLEVEA